MCKSWLCSVARKYEKMPRMIAAQQNSIPRRKKERDLRARPNAMVSDVVGVDVLVLVLGLSRQSLGFATSY